MKKFQYENYSSWRTCGTFLTFLELTFLKKKNSVCIRVEKVSRTISSYSRISERFEFIAKDPFPSLPINGTTTPSTPTYSKTCEKPLRATLITLIAMKSNHRSRFEERREGGRQKERERRNEWRQGAESIWLENEVRIIWTNSANELVFVELIGRINPIESYRNRFGFNRLGTPH